VSREVWSALRPGVLDPAVAVATPSGPGATVHASDLVERIPTVTRETTGAEAARVVAEYRLQALVVVGADGNPHAVVPGSQILGLIIPRYVRDDPTLAHALDEQSSDELCERLRTTTIGQLLDDRTLELRTLPVVLPEDTLLEIASVMVEGRYPMVVVRDREGGYHGVVVMSRALAAIARLAGEDSALVERRLTRDIADRGEPWPPPAVIGGDPPPPSSAGTTHEGPAR